MKKEELAKLQSLLATTNATWQAEENRYTGSSESDRKFSLGFDPTLAGTTHEKMASASVAMLQTHKVAMASRDVGGVGAAVSVDWRNVGGRNFITPVKDQNPCGSCVAFGTAATLETRLRVQLNDPNYPIDLSEAHLFYCYARAEGRNCANGWWTVRAFENVKATGVTTEPFFPYTPNDQACGLLAGWDSNLTKITGYRQLTSIADMKDWISRTGALSACFTVYTDFFAYRSGVYRYASGKVEGGHCVSIVGYDDVQGCWICKNSWGPRWGDSGFFRIAYGQVGIESTVHAVDAIVENLWISGKKILGLWTINEDRNAWVYLENTGWKRISNDNDNVFVNLLNQLSSAKTNNRPISVYLNNGLITQVYN